MTREITDTNDSYSDKDIPDGAYNFKVIRVVKKLGGPYKDKPFYIWTLEYEGVQGEQVLMPNMMGGLLKVLGCTEIKPGHYDWDTDLVVNQVFLATVSHKADKKDPSKMRQYMDDFKAAKEDVPF